MSFNEKKYNLLKEKYARMSEAEIQKAKKIYRYFTIVSLLTAIITIKLWSPYANKVTEVVKMNL